MEKRKKKVKKTWTLDPKTVAIIEAKAKEDQRNENVTVDILIQNAVDSLQ